MFNWIDEIIYSVLDYCIFYIESFYIGLDYTTTVEMSVVYKVSVNGGYIEIRNNMIN